MSYFYHKCCVCGKLYEVQLDSWDNKFSLRSPNSSSAKRSLANGLKNRALNDNEVAELKRVIGSEK